MEPHSLVAYLENDATHVHSGLTAERQYARDFYRGYDNGWGCILQELDIERSCSESVLVDAVLLAENERRVAELFMLKGPGGNGKSVALKRIAWEAAVSYNNVALSCEGDASLRIDPLSELHLLTGKRVFLFVDKVALVRSSLRRLLLAARSRSIPITVIGAERESEWNIYCEQLESFVRQEFAVPYLDDKEIESLLERLETHNALGLLKEVGLEERIQKFKQHAEGQLLVALHEATLGKPFEDIVVDEYRQIEPEMARNVYLDICTLHQFGAPVRAGWISRASGVSFELFRSQFLEPLEGVVEFDENRYRGDVHYRSRHAHVAEMLFDRILPDVEDRFDALSRMLAAANVDYSSDRETVSRLIRGRAMAEKFSNVEVGRRFYDRVQDAMPNVAFVLHQRAVFEMRHRNGSLVAAEQAAEAGGSLESQKPQYRTHAGGNRATQGKRYGG